MLELKISSLEIIKILEPAHDIMLFKQPAKAQATSKGSGEPAHHTVSPGLCCLHTWSMEVDKGSDKKSDI